MFKLSVDHLTGVIAGAGMGLYLNVERSLYIVLGWYIREIIVDDRSHYEHQHILVWQSK